MDIYTLGLALGGVGLAGMALGGAGRSRHGAKGHGRIGGHRGSARGAQPTHGAHGGAKLAAAKPAGVKHAGGRPAGSRLLSLLAPRYLFSFALGFGVAGKLLHQFAGGSWLPLAAIAGGLLFERLLFTPLFNLASRFESGPAATLEHSVTDHATAVTAFDGNGDGIVAIEVDGQMVQILGRLQPSDRARGVKVRAGTRVRVEDVDPTRNRCTVSVIGAP